ncbi:hypothetical protein D3C81_1401600 [compost metagenome]
MEHQFALAEVDGQVIIGGRTRIRIDAAAHVCRGAGSAARSGAFAKRHGGAQAGTEHAIDITLDVRGILWHEIIVIIFHLQCWRWRISDGATGDDETAGRAHIHPSGGLGRTCQYGHCGQHGCPDGNALYAFHENPLVLETVAS